MADLLDSLVQAEGGDGQDSTQGAGAGGEAAADGGASGGAADGQAEGAGAAGSTAEEKSPGAGGSDPNNANAKPDAGSAGDGAGAAGAAAAAKPETVVPIGALHEARRIQQELRAKIAELEGQPKLTAEDAEILKDLRAQKAAGKEQPAVPDFVEDPQGHIDGKIKPVLDKLEALTKDQAGEKATREQHEQRQAQEAELRGALNNIAQQEATFTQTNPDYQLALNHLRSTREGQLRVLFPDATQDQINQQLTREEVSVGIAALQRKQDPAATIYSLAKTYGYVKTAAKDPAAEAAAMAARAFNGKGADPDAARSMGSGSGDSGADEEDGMPELKSAQAERFGSRRR